METRQLHSYNAKFAPYMFKMTVSIPEQDSDITVE